MKATSEQMASIAQGFWDTAGLVRQALACNGFESASRLLNVDAVLKEPLGEGPLIFDLRCIRRDLARVYMSTPASRPKRRWKVANVLEAVDELLRAASGNWKPDNDGSCFELYCARKGASCAHGRNRLEWSDAEFYGMVDRTAAEALAE